MTEAFGIRACAGSALVWGTLFLLSATDLVDALTAHPMFRDGADNLGVGLVLVFVVAFFFFGEEGFIAKFRLGRERMDWWETLPLCAAINIVAAVLFIESLARAGQDG